MSKPLNLPSLGCGSGAFFKPVIASMALAFATAVGAQQGAHEHGVAELRVALESSTLLIEFDSPLDGIVGFEHAPSTDQQREALLQAERSLQEFTPLFTLPAAAGCVLADVQLESPYPQGDDDHDEHDHDEHDHDEHDHDEHDHDEHRHDEADAHADLYVVYQFECANPASLDRLDVRLFDAFPRLQTVRAAVASPQGQSAVRIDRASPSLRLQGR
ncbi:DUF2796 domain-containing protein [Rhodocyclaceae bacterium SMB388]